MLLKNGYFAAAAAISFVIAFVMHALAEQTIVASALGSIMVFSALLFRSFGKDDDKIENINI
jgi:hypothetical protein